MKNIERLMKYETAGDPMTGLKWTRKTTTKISEELASVGIDVSARKVAGLLEKLGFCLRVNRKDIESGFKPKPGYRKARQQQFEYIANMREKFTKAGDPTISIDTKKKELIGNFKNNGSAWRKEPRKVKDHDFRSDAEGMAVPYGIYDMHANCGTIFIGTSRETPAFATDCIARWWQKEGYNRYSGSNKLLILADCGGGNSARSRVWKRDLQDKLCNTYGVTVTVCHYPPGSSKWNPIEHRLFSEISKNWASVPLDSYETALKYIRTTTTATGLKVRARINRRQYETGERATDDEMVSLNLAQHSTHPQWNYTLNPS